MKTFGPTTEDCLQVTQAGTDKNAKYRENMGTWGKGAQALPKKCQKDATSAAGPAKWKENGFAGARFVANARQEPEPSAF